MSNKAKSIIAPDYKTLATEFESFDLLWFHIETRARECVENLNRPMLDKMVENSDNISQLQKENKEKTEEIK